MNKYQKEIIKIVIASLYKEPEKWNKLYGKLVHKDNGMSVWVANGRYGIYFEYHGYYIGNVVTFFTSFWPLFPFEWWRFRLRRACDYAMNKNSSEILSKLKEECLKSTNKNSSEILSRLKEECLKST